MTRLLDKFARHLVPLNNWPLPHELMLLRDWLNRHSLLVLFAIYLVFFGAVGLHLGGDGTPDLRIYHRYNGFAAVSGGRPLDIAPAQLQTFFYPGLDALYFRLTEALNAYPRMLHVVMALPYALATLLVLLVGRLVIPADWPRRDWLAGIAALFGITGAAAFATIGTTMSEIVPGMPFLAGAALWFSQAGRQSSGRGVPLRMAALAGALCGMTIGFKLTTVPLFVGLFLAVFLTELPRPGRALVAALLFGAAGVVATFAVAGPFWWSNYQLTGNPIFPAYNDLFRSDWVEPGRWTDDRFKPHDWPSILLYPATWAFTRSNRAIELLMRDPRMLMMLAAIAAIALRLVLRGRCEWAKPSARVAALLGVFLFVAFVLWQYQFSIYRYLALVESFSGVMVVAAAIMWVERRHAIALGWVLIIVGTAVAVFTRYPWWDRAKPAAHAYEVTLPAVPENALVIILDDSALSHVVSDLPPGARVITSNGNLVRPGRLGTLQARIEQTIRTFDGPIWGFENTRDFPGGADAPLQYYGLRRTDDCAPIISNIDTAPHRGCRLERTPRP